MSKPIFPAFLSCQGEKLTDEEKRLFSNVNPLGICLFAIGCENIKNRRQLQKLTTEIKETIGREDVLIAVDQEGGRVRRLSGPEFTPVAEQKRINTAELAEEHAYLISSDLKSSGINVNFAPVLDIEYEFTSQALKGRCLPGDLQQVAELGKIMLEEYQNRGICPCVKHLPGHGRGAADPHLELPIIRDDLAVLAQDFYPFKFNSSAPMGMVAHILLEKVDDKYPATLSKQVIQRIIRGEIGFSGLLVSDAIVMRALKGSITERAEQAVAAGCEIICLGNADFAANQELCHARIAFSDSAAEKLQQVAQIVHRNKIFTDYEHVKKNYCEKLKNIIGYDSKYDATEVLSRLRK